MVMNIDELSTHAYTGRPLTLIRRTLFCLVLCSFWSALFAATYPDQSYVLRIDSLVSNIESSDGVVVSSDGKRVQLLPDRTDGYFILKPQFSQYPFNQGLPSWNGSAPESNSAFKVQMRFPYAGGWSGWLTVGFWRANIWSSYGSMTYGGGYIDYDNVVLNAYVSSWQFKVIMTRTDVTRETPTLSKLSFVVSDSATTTLQNYTQILSDKPAAVFVPTTFIYQYGVDPVIGGDICSPTSVSMVIRSYNIPVDPLVFARATLDPRFNMYGIWPRVVQHASQYGLDGAVTRYRSWSQAREVLANGGRIAMSVGKPLYSGHLMMLAGFNANGDPIVHDPARSNGYSYVFNKSDLSHSWFDKGGVAYTFYPGESVQVASADAATDGGDPRTFQLCQNYPNPFNPTTVVSYLLPVASRVRLVVYDLLGREVAELVNEEKDAGVYRVTFNATNLPSGTYICRLQVGSLLQSVKMSLIK
jgi:hypothetical protein